VLVDARLAPNRFESRHVELFAAPSFSQKCPCLPKSKSRRRRLVYANSSPLFLPLSPFCTEQSVVGDGRRAVHRRGRRRVAQRNRWRRGGGGGRRKHGASAPARGLQNAFLLASAFLRRGKERPPKDTFIQYLSPREAELISSPVNATLLAISGPGSLPFLRICHRTPRRKKNADADASNGGEARGERTFR